MIIKHVPDPDGNVRETDTDKLPDVNAELLELSERIRETCLKYKRQFFLVVNIEDDQAGKGHTFWNFRSAGATPDAQSEVDINTRVQLTDKELKMFYGMISSGVFTLSNGNAVVMVRA